MRLNVDNPECSLTLKYNEHLTRNKIIEVTGMQLLNNEQDCTKLLDFDKYNNYQVTKSEDLKIQPRIILNREHTKFFTDLDPIFIHLNVVPAKNKKNDSAVDEVENEISENEFDLEKEIQEVSDTHQQVEETVEKVEKKIKQPVDEPEIKSENKSDKPNETSQPKPDKKKTRPKLEVLDTYIQKITPGSPIVNLTPYTYQLQDNESHLTFALFPVKLGENNQVVPFKVNLAGYGEDVADEGKFEFHPNRPIDLRNVLSENDYAKTIGILYVLYGLKDKKKVTPSIEKDNGGMINEKHLNAVQRKPRTIDGSYDEYDIAAYWVTYNPSKVTARLKPKIKILQDKIHEHFKDDHRAMRINELVLNNAVAALIDLYGPNAEITNMNDLLDSTTGKSLVMNLNNHRELQSFFTNHYFADQEIYQATLFLRDAILSELSDISAEDLKVFQGSDTSVEDFPQAVSQEQYEKQNQLSQSQTQIPSQESKQAEPTVSKSDNSPYLQREDSPIMSDNNFSGGEFATAQYLTQTSNEPNMNKPPLGRTSSKQYQHTTQESYVVDNIFELLQSDETLSNVPASSSGPKKNKKSKKNAPKSGVAKNHTGRNIFISVVIVIVILLGSIFGFSFYQHKQAEAVAPQVEQIDKQQEKIQKIVNHKVITNADVSKLNDLFKDNAASIKKFPQNNFVQKKYRSQFVNNYNMLVKTETKKVNAQSK